MSLQLQQFHTFVYMTISSCITAIGLTFSVHLDVSSFPIGETPIRIDGFFVFEVLTHPLLFHLQVGEGAWLHCTLLAMHAPVSVCNLAYAQNFHMHVVCDRVSFV